MVEVDEIEEQERESVYPPRCHRSRDKFDRGVEPWGGQKLRNGSFEMQGKENVPNQASDEHGNTGFWQGWMK